VLGALLALLSAATFAAPSLLIVKGKLALEHPVEN